MTWIKNLINKIGGYFNKTPQDSILGENLLCVFLHRDSDYLFIKSEEPATLMFPTSVLSSVEDHAENIHKYLLSEFGVSPEKIHVHLGLLSLKPLFNKTLSFATVDLTDREFEELAPYFKVYCLPHISLYSDNNLFFNVLTRILAA